MGSDLLFLEGGGGGEPDELDALLLGVGDLALRAGHVGAVAAVEAFHAGRVLADRGADAVHRGVAAADHDDVLAHRVESGRIDLVAEAAAVRGGEIVERRDRAVRAGHLDLARFVHSGRDQQRVVTLAKLVQRRVAADLEAFVEDESRPPSGDRRDASPPASRA